MTTLPTHPPTPSLAEPLLFAGLKVIDCASYIAGPAAATILADFGADVIKIEPPEGDAYRNLWRATGAPAADHNYPWEFDNRNKRGLALDLKHADAIAVLHRLVTQCDVFVTNLPLPVRSRLQIGHESLLALNPRLIYASMTAYGEVGPEAEKSGFDATAYWARSGMQDMVKPDHSAPPARAVAGLGDHPTATSLYAAIVTALYRRERTGQGGHVSTSLMGNGLWAHAVQVQAQLMGVKYPPRQPRSNAPNPFGNPYCCHDGRWLNLVMLNEARQLPPLMAALESTHLLQDPRFATQEARRANTVELIALLDLAFAKQDLAEWRKRLDNAGITFGVVGTLADIDEDVQMHAAGDLVPFADGAGLTVSNPVHVAGNPHRAPTRAPGLGQHSTEILQGAGFGEAEIQKLRSSRVIQ